MDNDFQNDFGMEESININVKNIFKENGEELRLATDIEMELIKIAPSGAMIKTHFNLEKKMTFCFELPIGRNMLLPVAEIIVKGETKEDYLYGCKFVKLPYDDEAKIKRHIFENQLKNRKGDSHGR